MWCVIIKCAERVLETARKQHHFPSIDRLNERRGKTTKIHCFSKWIWGARDTVKANAMTREHFQAYFVARKYSRQ